MAKQFPSLTPALSKFIAKQQMFFVATAMAEGKVNMSPKGGDSFRVISPTQVAWLNHTGSGNESATHVQHDTRMTIMFCAFEGAPMILRLYGQATALHQGDPRWPEYIDLFPESVASRQVFVVDLDLVQTSCGMQVPLFDYVDQRDALAKWSDKQGKQGIEQYWRSKNQVSFDGHASNILALSGLSNEEA